MAEVIVEVPEELKREVKGIPGIELSLVVSRLLKAKLERIVRLERIVSKSKLSEEKANELADEISLSLSRRYEKLHKRRLI